jgi:flavodoxin
MKRTITFFLILTLVLALSACGQNATEKAAADAKPSAAEQNADSPGSGAKVLVAYFSQTGNTRPLAEHAAELLHADLYEIKAADPYTDADINYGDSESRTTKEQNDPDARPEIAGSVEHMEQYDTVVLAYPIWWGQAPRIISTFMESYDFSGKTIIPFCTSGSSGIGSSAEDLKALCSDTAVWVDGKRFPAGDTDALEEWLLGLPELTAYL